MRLCRNNDWWAIGLQRRGFLSKRDWWGHQTKKTRLWGHKGHSRVQTHCPSLYAKCKNNFQFKKSLERQHDPHHTPKTSKRCYNAITFAARRQNVNVLLCKESAQVFRKFIPSLSTSALLYQNHDQMPAIK